MIEDEFEKALIEGRLTAAINELYEAVQDILIQDIQEHMVITKNFLETISMKKTKFTGFCLRSKFSELDTFVWTVV